MGTRSKAEPVTPCEGVLPIRRIVGALLENEYAGPIELEVCSERVWKQDYETLLRDQLEIYQSLAGAQVAS